MIHPASKGCHSVQGTVTYLEVVTVYKILSHIWRLSHFSVMYSIASTLVVLLLLPGSLLVLS